MFYVFAHLSFHQNLNYDFIKSKRETNQIINKKNDLMVESKSTNKIEKGRWKMG